MVLAPVHAGYRDEDRHGDRGDEEQPPPPAAGVADDQDRHGDVETAGGGLVPGGVGGGGQVLVELGDAGPGPLDHGGGGEERAQFPEHDGGYEDDRPPVPGDGEKYDAGRHADDDAEDQHPGHHDPGGDAAVVASGPATSAGFRPGRLEVGAGLGFQSLGDRIGHRLAGGAAGQLEGEGRDPEPGDADRPGAQDVGQVMHAEQD